MRARWLIVAPDPDDETLGAGALIHETAARRQLAGIAYLTDGTGSHPHGTPESAQHAGERHASRSRGYASLFAGLHHISAYLAAGRLNNLGLSTVDFTSPSFGGGVLTSRRSQL